MKLAKFSLAAAMMLTASAMTASAADVVNVSAVHLEIKDDNLFKNVVPALKRIPDAKVILSAKGKPDSLYGLAFRRGVNARAEVEKALSDFKVSFVSNQSGVTTSGTPLPFRVGTSQDYVKQITFTPDANNVVQKKTEMDSVDTGISIALSPKKNKSGIDLSYDIKMSELTGPDDGFRIHKVGSDSIQLKEVTERHVTGSAEIEDGGEFAIIMPGMRKNEYLISILGASSAK